MSDKAQIMCVDDEPINLTIMEELLQDQYLLDMASSGEECLQQIGEQKPDLILLDVNMPGVSGLEICRNLKLDPETSDIPIIFISALASHSELMAGYEAGGDDYITKPFSEAILQKKIDVVLTSQRKKLELKLISDQAVEALQVNLSNFDALAVVIRFLYQSHVLKDLDELAEQVVECLRKLDLEGSLLMVDGEDNRIWFSDNIDRPMERQILESLRLQDHVVSFGTRVAVNSDNATLLVRKLPVEQERTQRLQKLLEILVEGLNVRIRSLLTQKLLDQRRDLLGRVLEATRDSLASFDDLQQAHRDRCRLMMSHMAAELKQSLTRFDLNLNKNQSAALAAIIESAIDQADSIYDDGLEITDRVQATIDELSQALEK